MFLVILISKVEGNIREIEKMVFVVSSLKFCWRKGIEIYEIVKEFILKLSRDNKE